MENSGNCNTLAAETIVVDQEESQPHPSDFSASKLALSATIQETVNKNSVGIYYVVCYFSSKDGQYGSGF